MGVQLRRAGRDDLPAAVSFGTVAAAAAVLELHAAVSGGDPPLFPCPDQHRVFTDALLQLRGLVQRTSRRAILPRRVGGAFGVLDEGPLGVCLACLACFGMSQVPPALSLPGAAAYLRQKAAAAACAALPPVPRL